MNVVSADIEVTAAIVVIEVTGATEVMTAMTVKTVGQEPRGPPGQRGRPDQWVQQGLRGRPDQQAPRVRPGLAPPLR